MTLALITFVMTLTMVMASYWLFVTRPEERAAAQLRGRLQMNTAGPAAGASLVKSGAAEGMVAGAGSWWHRLVIAPVAGQIEKAGLRTRASKVVGGTAVAALLVTALFVAAGTSMPAAVTFGLLTPLAPYAYLRHRAQQRLNAFEECFPEAIDLMARALRAGHTLPASLSMIAEELPDPARSEFRMLYEQQNYGMPLPQVLRAFAARLPLVDVRLFVTAVLTQRETGGNLTEILDNLAAVTRDRFRVRRQLRVLTAQGRMTGWILSGLPLGLALVLYLVNPAHMHAFLRDPLGAHMLQLAAALQVIGTLAIRKIVAVEY
jgi:tight adherence protein B